MKIKISRPEVISTRHFKKTELRNIFTNKNENSVAVVERDHAILIHQESYQSTEINDSDNGTKDKEGEAMGKQFIKGALRSIVETAVLEDVNFATFFHYLRLAVFESIRRGYVFPDYLRFKNSIEDRTLLDRVDQEEWDACLETAFKRHDIDYRAKLAEQEEARKEIEQRILWALNHTEIDIEAPINDCIHHIMQEATW